MFKSSIIVISQLEIDKLLVRSSKRKTKTVVIGAIK